jgi:hypothetical protein
MKFSLEYIEIETIFFECPKQLFVFLWLIKENAIVPKKKRKCCFDERE